MGAGGLSDEDLERAPRVAAACDPTQLELTPAEGFLLSRIDGRTSWRMLREIGGLQADQVDACLERWSAAGVVAWSDSQDDAAERGESDAQGLDLDVDESLIDPALDIDVAVQRRILVFEGGLERSYHELLGVDRSAEAREIKRRYFQLSKEFHPDRFFRREVGDYGARLDRIFKKILEAYELLSDPVARSEIEKSMPYAPPPSATPSGAEETSPAPEAPRGAAPRRAPKARPARALTRLERLRRRTRVRMPESVLAERRQKASLFFEAARVSKERGRLAEAASSIRLAVAFDPSRGDYKESFAEIQSQLAAARVAEILERDDVEPSERREALRLCEETLLYRPHDPEVNYRAACLALDLDQVEKASECARRAIEHSPEVGRYHRALGRVYGARGDKGHAIHELEQAVQLDADDQEARRLLALYGRRAPAPANQGGRR